MSVFALAAVAAQFIGPPPALAATSIEAGRGALTEFLTISVSATGQVLGCDARLNTGAPVDDPENCRRLQRAALRPAHDDAGTPVSGIVTLMVPWRTSRSTALPAEIYVKLAHLPAVAGAQAVSALTLVVGADGRPESCSVARSSGSDALDRVACRTAETTGLTVPPGYGVTPAGRYVRPLLVGFIQDGPATRP